MLAELACLCPELIRPAKSLQQGASSPARHESGGDARDRSIGLLQFSQQVKCGIGVACLTQVSGQPEQSSGPDGKIPGAGKRAKESDGAIVVAVPELEPLGRCEYFGRSLTVSRNHRVVRNGPLRQHTQSGEAGGHYEDILTGRLGRGDGQPALL